MEAYKRDLCSYINNSTSEEEIYNSIKDNPKYTCNLNEDGLLHSTYNGTHYEPAIIYKCASRLNYYWMFDGKIKDCLHPFSIGVIDDQMVHIEFYSSEIIKSNNPVFINYMYSDRTYKRYNKSFNYTTEKHTKILNDDRYRYEERTIYVERPTHVDRPDKSMFTSEWYPLFNEMEEYKFKFVD